MEENRDIRGLLQEQFAHFEAEPGVDLWAGIEAGLHTPPAPKRRKGIVWMSIAASIILLLSMFWLLQPSSGSGDLQQIAEQDRPDAAPKMKQNISTPLPTEEVDTGIHVLPVLPQQEAPVQFARNQQSGSLTDSKTDSQEEKRLIQQETTPMQDALADRHPGLEIAPLNPMAAASWKNSSIDADIPKSSAENLIAAQSPKAEKAEKREVFYPKNNIDFNDLTLGQAIVFASTEISKLAKSPVKVRHEKAKNEKASIIKFDFLNFSVTSNETTKTSADPEKVLASAEPVEKINTFQLDLFNFKIKKKTHKRVINKKKS